MRLITHEPSHVTLKGILKRMSGFFRLARWLALAFGLVVWAGAQAQDSTEDLSPKISPSLVFRLDWLSTAGVGLQVGVQARGELPHRGGAVFFNGALWLIPAPGVAVLEFYDAFKLEELEFSIGKRAKLIGPWQEGVLGYDGLPGLYVGYPLEEGLSLEGALLLEDGLLRTFVGGVWGDLQFGVLLRPDLVPLLVYQADIFSVGLQTDRGLWGKVGLPLELFEGVALKVEGLVWWRPGFVDNGSGERTFVTQRFFLSLAASIESARFGFDVVRAPLEAYKLWLEYRLKF